MSWGEGCPSWVAANRARKEGEQIGYSNGYNSAKQELKKKYFDKLGNAFKKKMLNDIKEEIKKELKEEELKKLKEELTEELTKEINEQLTEEMFSKLEKYEAELKKNITIFLPNLNIIVEEANTNNCEEYVQKKFEEMGYQTEDCRRHGQGHPDYKFTKKNERVYVEVKSDGDGLRMNQANWILKNKHKKVILYFVNRKNTQKLNLAEIE